LVGLKHDQNSNRQVPYQDAETNAE